jgi:hypothetical protein
VKQKVNDMAIPDNTNCTKHLDQYILQSAMESIPNNLTSCSINELERSSFLYGYPTGPEGKITDLKTWDKDVFGFEKSKKPIDIEQMTNSFLPYTQSMGRALRYPGYKPAVEGTAQRILDSQVYLDAKKHFSHTIGSQKTYERQNMEKTPQQKGMDKLILGIIDAGYSKHAAQLLHIEPNEHMSPDDDLWQLLVTIRDKLPKERSWDEIYNIFARTHLSLLDQLSSNQVMMLRDDMPEPKQPEKATSKPSHWTQRISSMDSKLNPCGWAK